MNTPLDVTAIRALLERGSQLKFKNPLDVREVITQAHAAAQAIGDTTLMIEASCELAWCEIMGGSLTDGTAIALNALRLAREHNISAMECRAMGMIGIAFATSGNLTDALQVFERQKDLAIECFDYPQLAGVLSDIASIYDRLNHYERALDLFLQAQDIAKRYSVGVAGDYVQLNIAETYFNLQQYDNAIQTYQTLLHDIEGKGYDLIAGIAHVNLAKVLLTTGNMTEAINQCEAGWDIATQSSFPRLKMQSELGFYMIEQTKGAHDKALERLKNILALCNQYGQNEHKLPVLRAILGMQLEQDDTTTTLETYRQINEFIDTTLLGQMETRIALLRAVNESERAWAQVKFERERAERLEREIAFQRQTEEQHLLAERHRLIAEHQRDLFQRKEKIIERLSHEIRNPLAVISGGSEMIQRYHAKMTPDKLLDHANQIYAETQRISRMLNEVLNAVNLDEPPVL